MLNVRSIQWRLDNQGEIEGLLDQHVFRCKQVGDDLLIQAAGGLNASLSPGDSLVLDGDRLGIVRVPYESEPPRLN